MAEDEVKLLPCPFCGEPELIQMPTAGDYDPTGNVLCLGCGAEGPIRDAAGQRADAIERWNTRAIEATRPTDDGIKHMVNRFLMWKLPENFHPDAGISFKPTFNDHMNPPMRHNPIGTNLLDAMQAEEMVRFIVEGIGA